MFGGNLKLKETKWLVLGCTTAVVALRFTLRSGSGAHIVCRDHNPLVRDLSSLCTELNYHQKWMHNWPLALDSTSEKMEKHLTSTYNVFTRVGW